MAKTDEQQLCCSFCGKRETQARLIAGPGVCICSDCVQACCDLLRDDEQSYDAPDHLPTPREIKAYMDGYDPIVKDFEIKEESVVLDAMKFGGGEGKPAVILPNEHAYEQALDHMIPKDVEAAKKAFKEADK